MDVMPELPATADSNDDQQQSRRQIREQYLQMCQGQEPPDDVTGFPVTGRERPGFFSGCSLVMHHLVYYVSPGPDLSCLLQERSGQPDGILHEAPARRALTPFFSLKKNRTRQVKLLEFADPV